MLTAHIGLGKFAKFANSFRKFKFTNYEVYRFIIGHVHQNIGILVRSYAQTRLAVTLPVPLQTSHFPQVTS